MTNFILILKFALIYREHVGEWDEDDFPHTEHRSLFPHCPFVRGLDVGNIASNAESRETFERLGLVHSQSQHEGLSRIRGEPSRDVTPNRNNEQRFRRNSNNIQSRPDPSANVRLRPNSGRSSTSYQRQHSDQPQRPRSTSYDHSNPPLYDRSIVEHSSRPQSMMLGAENMMEESFDEAGIRPRYNGPEKGNHIRDVSFFKWIYPTAILIILKCIIEHLYKYN